MTTTTEDPERQTLGKRYVYCLVDTSSVTTLDIDTGGMDGTTLSLVRNDDIGAVVHECERVYDDADETKIRQWLVEHQQVVDAASDAFGTPLPVRFGTVLDGDDAVVETWLSSHAETIRDQLASFSGRWEYRIDLRWDSGPYRETVAETDERLQELERRKDEASAGKGFMLKKQYSNRLRELVTQRERELQSLLDEQVVPVVVEKRRQESGVTAEAASDEKESITQLSVLAAETNETELGARLDTVAEEPGVELRFTGPWPPYTFAPELG